MTMSLAAMRRVLEKWFLASNTVMVFIEIPSESKTLLSRSCAESLRFRPLLRQRRKIRGTIQSAIQKRHFARYDRLSDLISVLGFTSLGGAPPRLCFDCVPIGGEPADRERWSSQS